MELSELAAYAEEKFHIREQHKWADFPGFSVLADPRTGKWIALLMRQWDSETGTEIQRCDLKCGPQGLSETSAPYLTRPFRMKGQKWVGIFFDEHTRPDVVFRLFDRAVYAGEGRGYTIVFDEKPRKETTVYADTPLPALKIPPRMEEPAVPPKIREMQRLYQYRNGSFLQKCKNFYRQGKFMESYEDNVPWDGPYRHYFPTYHDLSVQQLRGYFTWRTGVRKGVFAPIPASFAYLYLYELLNGIGARSPEESLEKMRQFEAGFLDSGIGDASIRKYLYRWMLEYAVVSGLPPEKARTYADPKLLAQDAALAVLKAPEKADDEAVFSALCTFAGKKLSQSPVLKKDAAHGKHLFAAVWREALRSAPKAGEPDLFTACFGARTEFRWYPLGNAVHWEAQPHKDADYTLDSCRSYRCRGGKWWESRFDPLYFDRKKLHALLHETDRRLRKAMKTGHYLHENADEAWVTPYVEAVIKAERRAALEAARPKITIHLSALAQIREDAGKTRDSLLTEDEMDTVPPAFARAPMPTAFAHAAPNEHSPAAPVFSASAASISELGKTALPVTGAAQNMDSPAAALDADARRILSDLLSGKPVDAYIKAHHLMPSVVADAVNEAFFDEIGDNVLDCDGAVLAVVEDYKDDVLKLLGGEHHDGK